MGAEGLERLVPDRRLLLDGNVVAPDLAAKITRITVELSDGVFNECRVVFTDADLKLIGGKELMGGVGLQVELGYLGKVKPVFDGEIVSVEPRFVRDHPPSVIVRALEPLHRLALAPKTRSFQDATTAQIVSQVAKEHGLSGSGPSGGAPAHLLQPNITDYSLLRKIAARTGNRIGLDGKKLTLGPPPSLGEVPVLPGDGVKRLKVALRTSEQVPKVVVRGWDWKQKKEIVGQAQPTGEAKDGADAAKPFGVTEFFIEGILVNDTAEAQAIAKAAVAAIAERYATAKGELVGNPEVLPGKVLAFDKMGDTLDGKYRITSSRHEFDKRGYRVFFEATRVAKKKTVTKFKAPPQIKEEQKTFIEAVLVDQSGKPMSGVQAKVEVSGEAPRTMYTDAKGKIRIDQVPKGKSYSITFGEAEAAAEPDAPPPEAGAPAPSAGAPPPPSVNEASADSDSSASASDSQTTDASQGGKDGASATPAAAASAPAAAAPASDAAAPAPAEEAPPKSTDPARKLENVAIAGAPGPLFCGSDVTVTGQGTKVTVGGKAIGHLFKAGGPNTDAFLKLSKVTIAEGGAVSGTGKVANVHKLGAAAQTEVQAHLNADGAEADSTKATKIARLPDFTNEAFPSAPHHASAGFSDLVARYLGTFDGKELKLNVRIKYRQGWRRWVLTDAKGPGWAERTATGWSTWDSKDSKWAEYKGTVRDSMIRELVLVKDGSGKVGPWLDPYYAQKLGAWPGKDAAGNALPDYTLGAADLSASVSSIKEAWDDRFDLKRKGCAGEKDCCRYRLRVEPTFGADLAEHDYEITYVGSKGGAGRANVNNWYDVEEFFDGSNGGKYGQKIPVRKFVHAHEVGHMMGAYDEYVGGAVGPDNLIDGKSIMGSGYLSDVSTNSKPYVRHIGDAATFLTQVVKAKKPELGWEFELKNKGEA